MIPQGIEELFDGMAEAKEFHKGQKLYQVGESIVNLYIVDTGKVKVTKPIDKEESTIQIAKTYDLIGESGIFTRSTHTDSAYFLEDSIVKVVNKKRFEREIIKHNDLLVEMIKWMETIQMKNQSKFRDLLHYGKKGALYSTLIRLANSYGVVTVDGILIDVKLTNQTISDFCGATRESVNKMLKQLEEKDVLTVTQKYINIVDIEYLKRAIHCENCPFEICQI